MKRTTISLDLAKNIIQVCHIDKHGEILMNKAMPPNTAKAYLAKTKPCIVAMEACGGFHHWARLAQHYGHTVKGMSPKLVKPFISRQKTDANDAIGIAIASSQPSIPISLVKSIEQQSLQSLQVSRKWVERSITSLGNHIRALCFEYGLIIAKGKSSLCKTVSSLLEPECCELPAIIKNIMESLWSQYLELGRQFKTLSTQFKQLAEQSDSCQRLMKIEGIGPVGAVGLISSLGDGRHFKNGRHASVYIGATPKQHSSGGKAVMIGINKHGGDKALRSILYQGALAVISRLPDVATTHKQQWLINLVKRAGIKRACVALINKNIRTAWALLAHQTEYKVHTLNV